MSDEKLEEERIQRAMNRKPNRSSMLVKSGNEAPVSSTPNYASKVSTNAKSPGQVAQEKPKAVSFQAASPTSQHSVEIENLQMKKRTLLGTIVSTRRDLDEVRNEIAKLKAKESELVALLEKREQSVQQLTQEIEQLEQRGHAEDSKRKEEEKARRAREEIEKRRKEEEEEERRKIEEEEKKNIKSSTPLCT
jgi:chromosome segregation ATPase